MCIRDRLIGRSGERIAGRTRPASVAVRGQVPGQLTGGARSYHPHEGPKSQFGPVRDLRLERSPADVRITMTQHLESTSAGYDVAVDATPGVCMPQQRFLSPPLLPTR